jgi:hypothetical protein
MSGYASLLPIQVYTLLYILQFEYFLLKQPLGDFFMDSRELVVNFVTCLILVCILFLAIHVNTKNNYMLFFRSKAAFLYSCVYFVGK